jgi:hypothetical protein
MLIEIDIEIEVGIGIGLGLEIPAVIGDSISLTIRCPGVLRAVWMESTWSVGPLGARSARRGVTPRSGVTSARESLASCSLRLGVFA